MDSEWEKTLREYLSAYGLPNSPEYINLNKWFISTNLDGQSFNYLNTGTLIPHRYHYTLNKDGVWVGIEDFLEHKTTEVLLNAIKIFVGNSEEDW